MKDIERRYMPSELRVEGDESPKIRGYAAVFGELSENLGGFREKISAGAFAKSLDADVRALWNHDPGVVLGRTKSGTLRLEEDERGLFVEIDPPTEARSYIESIQRGDVDQMSFGFRVVKDAWEQTDDYSIRTLIEVDLFDVSPVTFPAYPQTSVAIRSVLGKAGIDFDALAGALIRDELTEEDELLVRASIDALAGFLPSDAGAEEVAEVVARAREPLYRLEIADRAVPKKEDRK